MGLTMTCSPRGFYDRLGYRIVGIIEDCPAGNDDWLVLQGSASLLSVTRVGDLRAVPYRRKRHVPDLV